MQGQEPTGPHRSCRGSYLGVSGWVVGVVGAKLRVSGAKWPPRETAGPGRGVGGWKFPWTPGLFHLVPEADTCSRLLPPPSRETQNGRPQAGEDGGQGHGKGTKETLHPFPFKILVSMATGPREENGCALPSLLFNFPLPRRLSTLGPARSPGGFLLSWSPWLAGPPRCQACFVSSWRRL